MIQHLGPSLWLPLVEHNRPSLPLLFLGIPHPKPKVTWRLTSAAPNQGAYRAPRQATPFFQDLATSSPSRWHQPTLHAPLSFKSPERLRGLCREAVRSQRPLGSTA